VSQSTQDADARRDGSAGLTMLRVLRFWLPLAASWLLMTTEMPTVNAFVARMADAKLQLAAFGIAFSLALAVESPVVSLLTAGNALARDRASYRLLRRFTLGLSALLTAVMLSLILTPLFDLVVLQLIGVPAEIATLVRPALWTLILWSPAIAYRRFHQGVMIRYGYTRQVSYGTAVRLLVSVSVAGVGLAWGKLDGATVGGLALGASVIAEAVLVHYLSRPAVRKVESIDASSGEPPLTLHTLLRFYSPLLLTSAVMLSTAPLINFGLARSPSPIESLAAWPVVSGQLLVVRSFGFSLQEVIVALLDGPEAMRTLRHFALAIGAAALVMLLVLAFTPLAPWWQQQIAGLSEELTAFAVPALQLALLLPALAVFQSWLRGIIVTAKATGAIAQATVINLVVLTTVLLVGANGGWMAGASVAALALTTSQLAESACLWRGARPAQRQIGEQMPVRVLPSSYD
jgi:hypothetical protein